MNNIRSGFIMLCICLNLGSIEASSYPRLDSNLYVNQNFQKDTLEAYSARFLAHISDELLLYSENTKNLFENFKADLSRLSALDLDTSHLKFLANITRYYGYYYYNNEKYEESIDYYSQTLELLGRQNADTSIYAATAYSGLGSCYYNERLFPESIESHLRSLEIREQLNGRSSSDLINTLVNLSAAYIESFRYDLAEMHARRALEIILLTNEYEYNLYSVYYNLGVSYSEKGDYKNAELFYNNAKEIILEHGGNSDNLIRINNAKAIVYSMSKDTLSAISTFQDAITIIDSSRIQGDLGATVFSNFGILLSEVGQINEAEHLYKRAINHSLKNFGNKSMNYYERQHFLASYYRMYKKDSLEAYSIASSLLSQTENIVDVALRASILQGYAHLLRYTKDYSNTLNLLNEFETRKSELGKQQQAYFLNTKGKVLLAFYEKSDSIYYLQEALKCFNNAIIEIDSVKTELSGEEGKLSISDEFDFVFDYAMHAAAELYLFDNKADILDLAFKYSEKSKASTLLASTKNAKSMKFHLPDSLLLKESIINSKIKYIEDQLHNERLEDSQDLELIAQHEKDLLDVFLEREGLLEQFETGFPNYYKLKYQSGEARISDVQDYLGRRKNLIEYYLTDTILYTFLINRKVKNIYKTVIDSSFIDLIKEFRNDLNNPITSTGARDQFARLTDNGFGLYTFLIAPIEDFLVSDELVIAADDLLSYIPFESLISDTTEIKSLNYRKLPFLFKDYDIEYAYSASLLIENKGRGRSLVNRALVFAPDYTGQLSSDSIMQTRQLVRDELKDIRGAKEEAIYISELIGGELYLDSEASESVFSRVSNRRSIVHLAMHTLLNDKDPMHSKMVFSMGRDSIEDGYLNTHEVYELQLDAKMVVLSSCNTGSGYLNAGEGVISLARGFMFAGSPSVVMSLWEVDDMAGSEIVKLFYKNLKRGNSKSKALRKARIKFLESSDQKRSHPYYWCSLVILGDDEALFYNRNMIILIVFAGIILVVLGIKFYKPYSS